MEWRNSYNIGIEPIDNQHREMFTLVKRLKKAVAGKTIEQELRGALTFLVQYSRKHFTDEEKYMMEIGYPEYERHKQLHHELVLEITDILLKIKKDQPIDYLKLVNYLIDWLITHIIKEYKKIARYRPA